MFGLMLSGGTVAALVVAGLVLRNKRMENGRKIYTTALAVSSLLVAHRRAARALLRHLGRG
ncbi:hypothetical protein [uncultured Cloacibacillus sp.]|uniref:hypothetical protein n=1 Tax=uncultured Cloacibacillus sp. TaxID=889794 RepID=UPI00320B138A